MIAPSSLLLGSAALATLAGCGWLAVAMEGHWRQVMNREPPGPSKRRLWRGLGVASLALSALLCLAADRPSMALLVWILLFAAGAAAIALILSWRPKLLRLLLVGARPDSS